MSIPICDNCGEDKVKDPCPCGAEMSDPDEKLDQLVRAASTPTLSSMFRAAQSKGLIEPAFEYGA